VELGSDQRGSQIVHPDLSAPISDSHEDLRGLDISVDGVDRAEMFVVVAVAMGDFDGLPGFFVCD
jgi:hypothetical protein